MEDDQDSTAFPPKSTDDLRNDLINVKPTQKLTHALNTPPHSHWSNTTSLRVRNTTTILIIYMITNLSKHPY